MCLAELAKYILLFSFSLALIIMLYRFGAEIELFSKITPIRFNLPPVYYQTILLIKKSFMERPSVRLFLKITLLVIGSRLILLLIGYMAIVLFREESGSFLATLEWMWNKWDAGHLLDIAKHGYVKDGEMRFFIVFFPLYPMMVRLFATITRNYVWAGFLVSHLSLILACFYLYKLVELESDEKTAGRAVKILLIFPQSFFLNIVYTDSLFLATSIICFYHLRKRKWLWAGFFGCLAALTRNFGILLLIPALMEYLKEGQVVQKLRNSEFKAVIQEFIAGKGYGILLIAFSCIWQSIKLSPETGLFFLSIKVNIGTTTLVSAGKISRTTSLIVLVGNLRNG